MARVEFNNQELTQRPRWFGDFGHRGTIMPGGAMIDPSEFPREDAVTVVADGTAAVDAEEITVLELSGPIPSGTILDFGAKKFAKLTADADAGATSLTVEALATQIDDTDTATYEGVGRKFIASGTILGRTFAERDANMGYGPVAYTPDTSIDDEDVGILFNDVWDADEEQEIEILRRGALIKVNFLDGWDDLDPILQQWVYDNFETTIGVS